VGRFDDRMALVTGAASGIGRATAMRLAAEGARVACADLDGEGAGETAGAIAAGGGTAHAVACDVSDPDSARRCADAAVEALGDLHVLVNAAGVGAFHHFAEVTSETWNRILGVNLNGTFHMSQAALPHLLASGHGAIVNVASLAGLIGEAYCSAYCVSKAGVVGLTRALAVEFVKRGLRVNCVCPGGVATPFLRAFKPPTDADPELLARMTLVQRLVDVDEVARSVAYLASPESRALNGVALPLDFGTSAA